MKKHFNKTARLTGKYLSIAKEFLFTRCKAKHGRILCEICEGSACGYVGEGFGYFIEHKDNDPYNWHPDNLQLSSPKCNTRKYHSLTVEKKRERGGERGSQEYTANKMKLFEQVKDVMKIDSMSMFKNIYGKPKFFDYVHDRMGTNTRILWKEIIADGALITGTVKGTVEGWLEEITDSSFGEYKKVKVDAYWYLEWRDISKPLRNLNEKFNP